MSPPKIITYDDGYAFRWNVENQIERQKNCYAIG